MMDCNKFAQRTGVHADHASKLCRQGKLPKARKVKGEWQIPDRALTAYLKARRARKAKRR